MSASSRAGVGEDRTGLVVISMVSLSASPPKVIACVNRSSSTWPVIERYRPFRRLFARPPIISRWPSAFPASAASRARIVTPGADWFTLETGASLLKGATAVFDCRLDEMIDRGSHSIIVGSVAAVRTNDIGEALLYWRGAYLPTRFDA